MSTRRMFSNRIANSARFLQMPSEAQLLYFHLCLRADDDGIVEAYPIVRLLGTAPDACQLLLEKKFVRQLNSDQVIVITDWLEHNNIRADRKVDSIYKHLLPKDIETIKPKPRSDVKNNNNRLNGQSNNERGPSTDRLGKVRLGKVRLGKDRLATSTVADCNLFPNQEFLESKTRPTTNKGKKTKAIKSTSLIATPHNKPENENKQIVEIINSFKEINPTINFGNKTQRKACEELIEVYGFDSVMFAIKYYKTIMNEPYRVVITTPYQLKEKYAQLRTDYQRGLNTKKKGEMTII